MKYKICIMTNMYNHMRLCQQLGSYGIYCPVDALIYAHIMVQIVYNYNIIKNFFLYLLNFFNNFKC